MEKKSLTIRQVYRLPHLTPRQAMLRYNAGFAIYMLHREKKTYALIDQNTHDFNMFDFARLYFNYPETARISQNGCLFLGLSSSLIGCHFVTKLVNSLM